MEEPDEAARVVCYSPNGSRFALGMCRSIGDLGFTSSGVLHSPDITKHVLEDRDKWLILATDGIWEFITYDDAVEIVSESWKLHPNATMATRALIARAKQLWFEIEGDYRDDITATVVDIPSLRAHLQANKLSVKPRGDSVTGAPPLSPLQGSKVPLSMELDASPLDPTNMAMAQPNHDAEEEKAAEPVGGAAAQQALGDQFMRRRASVLPPKAKDGVVPDGWSSKIAETEAAALEPRRNSDQPPPAMPLRRASVSPELDRNLWKKEEAEAVERISPEGE